MTHLWFYFDDAWSSFAVGFINTEQSILVNVTLITNQSRHRLHGRRASRFEFVAESPEAKRVLFLFFFRFSSSFIKRDPVISSGEAGRLLFPWEMTSLSRAKRIPDRADFADCHRHSKYRCHRGRTCACFGFCHLILCLWKCGLRCCKIYLHAPERSFIGYSPSQLIERCTI